MPLRVAALSLLLCPALIAQSERTPEQFQIALGLQQRGMHEEAARYFGEFVGKTPRHALAAEAHYRMGSCLLELGQQDQGIAALQQALERGGDAFRYEPEARYRLATALKDQGKLEPAARQFAALVGKVAGDHYLLAPARYAEGECRRDLKDDAAALQCFQAAAAAATGDQVAFLFPAWYQAGFALLRSQDPAGAAAAFGRAAAAAADDVARAECHYLTGDAALRAKELDPAQQAFEAAIKLGGDFVDDARFGLGWVAVERGDLPQAVRRFKTVVDRHGDSPLAPRARLEMGRLLFQQKQFVEAETALQPLLGDDKAADLQAAARELAGLCALERGVGDSAATQLQAALAAAAPADRPRVSFALGEALANQQQWEAAVEAYGAAIAGPDAELRGDALYGACFALHKLGRFDESTRRAETLRKELPQHRLVPAATFAIAENCFAQKQYPQAEREFAAAGAEATLAAKCAFKLAWCRYLLDDKTEAAGRFAKIAGDEQHPMREESLAMAALALLEAGKQDDALRSADVYAARYPNGAFLARTERVAARVLRQRNDLVGAAQRLERAAASGKDTESVGDLLEQAELNYQRGDYKAAQAVYGKLTERDDKTGARACEGMAWCAFELGDDAACTQWLTRGMAHAQVGDLQANLLELQSSLHHRQQDWPAAAAAARTFLDKFPRHGKVPAMRYALGLAQARGGDAPAARQTLQALAQQGGFDRMDRVFYELAWACRRSQDEAAALSAFGQVAALSKDQELLGEARLHLGTAALARQDEAAARDLLGKVEGRHRGRALYQLGFLDFEAGSKEPARLRRAQETFAALAALPNEPLAREGTYLVGECAFLQQDHATAAKSFRELLQAVPDHERAPMARLLLGECAVVLGDGEEAVRVLEEFLRGQGTQKGEQARAQLALGRARQQRREFARAEASYQKVTELSDGPLAAEAQFRIGESRSERGDLSAAADAFVKLPILYGHDEWIRKGLLHAGLTYDGLKQPEKARRFYDELIRRYPDAAETKDAQARLRGN
ncbi:MAG: tetratricopeptide repeat protein [Planctomycetes bacterium]|nr:tetratricopeptide repeat protein [Planctomycetota bacterium]